ncbi:fimbrial protein [Rahnella aquatilis]|uniref:CS1 type fimbrial major subunit n=1 Tax=Rahnella aquatilis (strain ATCC 33071 / DSM 4594 / JCM 1683 / NBRC 105701 / NCIMB 13365 / CIP 78.65) TaxID=745277 RepID=H2J274_RAHAC|nr:fimbrial protein [Rahnella aquatilis]AEX54671.1 CS1 type fimbrial major subunit [Rahnella aquatilis CIP 78.65 = ATCC 33071]KFD00117.1 alpha-fimbriae major subunit [Rahnella aquatilis CIP 78.65 = ATCC 33071]
MKKSMVKPLVIAALLVSFTGTTSAVQKDITVTANVDASIDMTLSDGSALPKSVEMQYIPGNGLSPVSMMTKIWSNATTSDAGDVHLQLITDPQLINNTGPEANPIPLNVSWGGDALSVATPIDLTTAVLFPNGADAANTGSVAKELQISQATKGTVETGMYKGVVSIYLFQDATTI